MACLLVAAGRRLDRFEDLLGFFELLQLLPLRLQLLFRLGDLGLELFGLFQDHLHGRLLLPRFAFRLVPRRLGMSHLGVSCFRIGRFRYWHRSSPVLSFSWLASVGLSPIAQAFRWLRASREARC